MELSILESGTPKGGENFKKMKNVLLVGDFRDCLNYGAIATTETLIELFMDCAEEIQLRTIGYRSFLSATPAGGWKLDEQEYLCKLLTEDWKRDKRKKNFALLLAEYGVLDSAYCIRDAIRKFRIKGIPERKAHIPLQRKDFSKYAIEALNGETLLYEIEQIKWADKVVINAEGSIVKGTNEYGEYRIGGMYALFIAYLCKSVLKKECHIVNHTVDPQNRDIEMLIKEIYPRMDSIYVREPLSKMKLESWGIKNAVYVPDALFSYRPQKNWEPSDIIKREIDFARPYICLGDSSGLQAVGIKIQWDTKLYYTELINRLKGICPQIIFIDGFSEWNYDINYIVKVTGIGRISLRNSTYHDLFHILKNSQLFLSGRWHTSILAVLAETPILLWGSDSHKTEALYNMLQWPYKFFEITSLPLHLDEIVDEAEMIIKSAFDFPRDRIEQLRKSAEKIKELLHN